MREAVPAGLDGLEREWSRSIELVGSYSRRHRGIFIPGESNVHGHLQTEDGRISGHLETIRLAPGVRLAVPAAGWGQ